ncbi:Protein-tyrosine-phosphatase MKP1 [Linum perenne]
MVKKEDGPSNPLPPCQIPPAGGRKMFWRSASWSSSRTALQNPATEDGVMDPNGNNVGSGDIGQNRRYPAPLTPRSQQSSKVRACLPPLQPLSIARRSLDEWPKAGSDDLGEWPMPSTPSGNKTGDRLKLDLSSIERSQDRNCGSVKRDRIAVYDKECSKVAEHVYLGGDAVAKDREILEKNGITHVLNCVGFVCPEYFKADFVYRTLWLQDSPSEDITSILYDVFDYFEDVREHCGRVFVHCCQGVSRSTSLVIAYLMWREGQSFDDAFQYVKSARGIADPNMGFACQLLQCQKRVHAFPLSPSSLLRMYRMAPHSPYDPLHLVPRMLNDPLPSALDSRGAFIIHIPSSMYLWVGKNCEPIMERDARGAVGQIVRYERAQGPIIVVKEGEEPPYFWDAFSNYLPLMDRSRSGLDAESSKISPGHRIVDVYNVDYEILKKAIKGGIVPPFSSSDNAHETRLPTRESSWSMLRRKFAPVDMKEFVSAPKIFLSRVYSDSMMIVHSSSPSSSSLVSSSSSSPPYTSPDSISSSDSSTNSSFSEASLDSPSVVSSSLPVSSTLSNFCDLTLSPRKPSVQLSLTSDGHGISVESKTGSKVVTSAKKSSPSLAECRGGLSKSLNLPVVSDKVTKVASGSHSRKDGTRLKNNGFSWCVSDSVELVLVSKGEDEGVEYSTLLSDSSRNNIVTPNVCDKEVTFVNTGDEHGGKNPHSSTKSSRKETASASPGLIQPLAYRWPSLERISPFTTNSLVSKGAFVVMMSPSELDRDVKRILYFWIGKSFSCGENLNQFEGSREFVDARDIDWDKIGCNFLTLMGLQMDAPSKVQVVKEGEEPAEFLAILSNDL